MRRREYCSAKKKAAGQTIGVDERLVGLTRLWSDLAWTPYYVTAAAVVIDQGGILSHGSIVAREHGLPCVATVGSATKHIQTRDMIKVDSDRGEVTLRKVTRITVSKATATGLYK